MQINGAIMRPPSRQHRVRDASAVSVRFAAASLSRDTLRSGPFTVGRPVATRKMSNRTPKAPPT